MVVYAAYIFGGMSFYFNKINQRRRKSEEDFKVIGINNEEIGELGDENPRFMYTI